MRLRRSILSTPANDLDMVENAMGLPVDEVVLDLEDAVPPAEKETARENVATVAEEFDTAETILSYRMNGLQGPHGYRDVVDIIEAAGTEIDTITVPKVRSAADVAYMDRLLTGIEANVGIEDPVGLEVLIEVTEGVQRVDEIAAASDRIETLVFGSGDYSTDIGIAHPSAQDDPEATVDLWHYARHRLLNAAVSNDIAPIDGAYVNFDDESGFRHECETVRRAGYVGKWVIHPSQIPTANDVFSPDDGEIARAKEVVAALEEAESEGAAAANVDGVMVDIAHQKQARETLEVARELGRLDDA